MRPPAPVVALAQQPPSTILLILASLLYLATAACLIFVVIDNRRSAARKTPGLAEQWRRDDWFWIAVAALLGLIAAYRASGLEYLLQVHFRTELRADHIYEERRELQAVAVVIALLVGLALSGLTLWYLRGRHMAIRLAAVTSLGLISLIGLRAISLHAFDALFGFSIAGIKLGWLLEAAPLVLLAGCALWFRRWRTELGRRPPAPGSRHRSDGRHRTRR